MMNYALLLLALKTWSLLHNCIGVHATTTIQKNTYSFDDVSSFPIHRNGNYEELMKREPKGVLSTIQYLAYAKETADLAK